MHLDVRGIAVLGTELLDNPRHISLCNAEDDSRKVGIVSQNAVRRLHQEIGGADFPAVGGVDVRTCKSLLLERCSHIDTFVSVLESLEGCPEIGTLYKVIVIFPLIPGIEKSRRQGSGDRIAYESETVHCLSLFSCVISRVLRTTDHFSALSCVIPWFLRTGP